MNSKNSCSGLLSATLCGFVLAGCNAVEDVREAPFTDIPTPSVVLQGTIEGLGSRRPLVLMNNGESQCTNPTSPGGAKIVCSFLGTFGATTSPFTFGALPQGTPYNITVGTQPFGKICTVANGTGNVGAAGALPITVTCVNDPAVPRFSVGGTVAAAVANTAGAKIILTTEEGVREIPAAGLTTFTFPSATFNSGTNLPLFAYTVTVTYPDPSGELTNNCAVTNGRNVNGAGEVVPPTGNVTNVAITACNFTVNGSASYSGSPAQAMGAGGLTLALRDNLTGVNVQTVSLATFTTFAFPSPVLSNAKAMYDLVVTRHPDGQHCIIASASNTATTTLAGAVMLLDPTSNATVGWFVTNRVVRCRAKPALANQLVGTYQLNAPPPALPLPDPVPPPTADPRQFLTFFEDGTFLYGHHNNSNTTSGVEQGFYAYNPTTGTIVFNVLVDTTGTTTGLTSLPGYASTAVTASNVVKTAGVQGTLSATFSSATATTVWNMTEPPSIDDQMTGTWVTADHLRFFVFNFSKTYGFHAGVNGQGNMQDACYTFDDAGAGTALTGYYTRRGGSTGCMGTPTQPPAPAPQLPVFSPAIAPVELPIASTTPRLAPLSVSRFPGSISAFDGRSPSPINYQIVPGTPDTLTVQSTLHGELIDYPVTFVRTRTN